MTKLYQLIVFDWDGTLMDSVPRITACMRAAIVELGLPSRNESQLRNVIGLGLREAMQQLYPDGDDTIYHQLSQVYREHYLHRDTTPMQLFFGTRGLLAYLRDHGHYLAIATGKSRVGLNQALQSTDLGDWFEITRCADESRSKPHPQMLQEIMQTLAIAPEQTLMVGDSVYDLQMARLAGTDAVGIGHGVHDKSRLMEHNPVMCVDSLPALQDWLHNNRQISEVMQ